MTKTKAATLETGYKIKRGTRRDKMLQGWLYNRVVRSIKTELGDFEEEQQSEAPAQWQAMVAEPGTVEAFCRVVLYTDRSNGSHTLVTDKNVKYKIEDYNQSSKQLFDAYWNWLCTDESVTDEIERDILVTNGRMVEPELLSKSELTDEERADPN